MLLIYNLIWSLLSSRSLIGTCFLCLIPILLSRYLSSVFSSIVAVFVTARVWASRGYLRPLSACTTCCGFKKGKELWCQAGNVRVLCRYARNYPGALFILPIPDPNPIPSLDHFTTWYWGVDICRSYRSTILQPWLRYNRWNSLSY